MSKKNDHMINNNGKAKVIQTNDGLSIIIPLKKNWFALLFATVWMGGWFFGFVNVVGILTRPEKSLQI